MLAREQGYSGTPSDLDELKQRSGNLKRDPEANWGAIVLLDSAIASHVDEIRAAVSTQTLAGRAPPGTNIYPDFVKQKLAFLDSEKAKFYDRGPFELARRGLLGTALEENYFIAEKLGKADPGTLRKAIQVVDEILAHYDPDNHEYDYLPKKQPNLQTNSHRFWRASLLFALGAKSEARDVLSALTLKTRQFGLETPEPGHIFIYRVFNRPYEITVQTDHRTEIKDPELLKRYYNPGQLTLLTCAHLEETGPAAIEKFIKAVRDLVFNDYYVIAASSNDPTKLRELNTSIIRTIESSQKLRARQDELLNDIKIENERFSTEMQRGARKCGIDDTVRDEIYPPLQFRSQIKYIDRLGKEGNHLMFGGQINASQANAIADFLNQFVFPEPGLRALQQQLGISNTTAYIARAKIDE